MKHLISCIMPTRNRPEWVARSLRYFEAQVCFWDRELVIVDGSDEPGAFPSYAKVIRPAKTPKIGEARNLACEYAAGDIILHWDDDDWYGPMRIHNQVSHLLESGAGLTGYNEMLFADQLLRRAWRYTHGGRYAIGTSLCYRRELWQRSAFPAVQVSEDNAFVYEHRYQLAVKNGRDIVASVHNAKTCRIADKLEAPCWRPVSYTEVVECMEGPEALACSA